MPSRPVGVTDAAPATTVAEVAVVEVPDLGIATTTTADPGAGGTTLAVTANARFPQTNNFKVRVELEVMLVTAGAGTNSWTVTRAQDGTTGVAHAIGVAVYQNVAVQRVSPVSEKIVSFRGRFATFRTPGLAGTVGQKLFAIHNATASPVLVDVNHIRIDVTATVIKAVTVLPPQIRLVRFTTLPTNGTAGTKVGEDTALTTATAVTTWQSASADGTASATTLTVTPTASSVIAQEFAPRMITAAGIEVFDRTDFFPGDDSVTLRALQGIVVFADYVLLTQSVTTDMYLVSCAWTEYTVA